jgi:hypothetical protein
MGKRKKKSTSSDSLPPPGIGGKQAWKVMDRGSSVAAAFLAREISVRGWKLATGKKPPTATKNPNPEGDLKEIALWAFVGGGLAELVRVLVKRSTASYWVKSTGHLPPGMKPVKTKDEEPPIADELLENPPTPVEKKRVRKK